MSLHQPDQLLPSRARKTWVVGDVQGCFRSFQKLLSKIEYLETKDELWLAGDTINRGPRSLETLEWLYERREHLRLVLGNHDLHLLMCWQGLRQEHPKDTISPILTSYRAALLLNWLRTQPLMFQYENEVVVHAGLHPDWTLDEAFDRANEVNELLRGAEWVDFLALLAEKKSDQKEHRWARACESIAVFTRIRMVDESHSPVFSYKGSPEDAPTGYKEWFLARTTRDEDKRFFFGHWAALGFRDLDRFVGLDSGCVWGNQLTAYCVETGEFVQQKNCDEI